MTPPHGYPFVAWCDGPAEVLACGPHRFRLLWRGRQVRRRPFPEAWMAILYAKREFLPTTPPIQ